jgi:hypothetical protein
MNCRRKSPNSQVLAPILSYLIAKITQSIGVKTLSGRLARRRALEAAGVVFIDENGGGPGVRLRERLKGKSRGK